MPNNGEVRYLRFLNETLQTNELRNDICDQFTRKIFNYLEVEPTFDAQVFCAFLYHFIYRCKLFKARLLEAQSEGFGQDRLRAAYAQIRLDAGIIATETLSFLNAQSIRFALPSVDSNRFKGSLEEKLKHLTDSDGFDRRKMDVRIILPEVGGSAGIVPWVDLEFTLSGLDVVQKLDVLHFAICALNHLSRNAEAVNTFAKPEDPSITFVSKPHHFRVISENLNRARDLIILNAIREKEAAEDEEEFDEQSPGIARILSAQSRDPQIEKQWLEGNPIVSVQLEIERHPSERTGRERIEGRATESAAEPSVKIKRHPQLTIDRAILLIDAIGSSRLKSADKEKLAEVIAFLTGDVPESVRKRYSALNPENEKYKGTSEKGMKGLREDLEILRYYIDLIGLRGELQRLSEKLGVPLTK